MLADGGRGLHQQFLVWESFICWLIKESTGDWLNAH